jgi:hypothetical protein
LDWSTETISEENDVDEAVEVVRLREDREEEDGVANDDNSGKYYELLPAPRDHMYLQEFHPRLPDYPSLHRNMRREKSSFASVSREMTATKRSVPSNYPRGEPFELLRSVVQLLGSTIPIKLRNRSKIQYLGRQMQRCRMHRDRQPRVELGILLVSED